MVVRAATYGEHGVIGDAGFGQFMQKRVAFGECRVRRPTSKGLAVLDDPIQRIFAVAIGLKGRLGDTDLIAIPVAFLPCPGEAKELWMQRADVQTQPIKGQTGGN